MKNIWNDQIKWEEESDLIKEITNNKESKR